jgi:hypothetical protein
VAGFTDPKPATGQLARARRVLRDLHHSSTCRPRVRCQFNYTSQDRPGSSASCRTATRSSCRPATTRRLGSRPSDQLRLADGGAPRVEPGVRRRQHAAGFKYGGSARAGVDETASGQRSRKMIRSLPNRGSRRSRPQRQAVLVQHVMVVGGGRHSHPHDQLVRRPRSAAGERRDRARRGLGRQTVVNGESAQATRRRSLVSIFTPRRGLFAEAGT